MSGFDTPNKRRSAVTGRTFPVPDGLIDEKDRQHLSLRSYRLTPRDEPQPDQEPQRGDCTGCDVSGSQLDNGCYELAAPAGFGFMADCKYCYPAGVHQTYPCVLRVPQNNQPALCGAFGYPHVREQDGGGCNSHSESRGFSMRFAPDDVDVEPAITSTPFRSNTQFRYMLRAVDLLIGPCQTHPPGSIWCAGTCCAIAWLCKVYSWGADGGWTMQCNTPERATIDDAQNFIPDQYVNVEKRFKVYPDTGIYRAPLFIEVATTVNENCFQFMGPYCWSDACDNQPGNFPEWDCVGQFQDGGFNSPREGWKPRHYLDRLYVYFSDDFGVTEDNETYPHKVSQTLATRNRQFRAIAANVTQIDGTDNTPGHSSREDYKSSRISKWRSVKTWAIEGAPIALTATARVRVRNMGIRATLVLTAAKIWLTLDVERLNTCRDIFKYEYRLHASITVSGYFQWKRDAVTNVAMASMGLSFLTDDLGDWRIADPDDPTIEHPSEFWYFRGDNGERINRTVTWRGLRSQWPYAAPNFADYACERTSGYADPVLAGTTRCCDAYQMIEQRNVYGEWNNCKTTLGDDGLPDPNIRNVQRFAGYVHFACPGLNKCGPENRYTHAETGTHCGCPDDGVGAFCDD